MAKALIRQAKTISASNSTSDPSESLQTFDLLQLQQYTQEKAYSPMASKDFHLFFVGRDDVHDILKFVLSRVRVSLYLNMFGYDDRELNDILMTKALNPRRVGSTKRRYSTPTESTCWQNSILTL